MSQKVERCVGLCGKKFSAEVKGLKMSKDVWDCVEKIFFVEVRRVGIVWEKDFCGGKRSPKVERCV